MAISIRASTASTTSSSTVATASPAAPESTVITGIGNRAGTGGRGPGAGRSLFARCVMCCAGATAPCGKIESSRRHAGIRSPVPGTRYPGFTLIEMLAVIVLIAIGAGVAAVSLHGRSRGQLQAAAQRVAAGLRDTRVRAMATGKPQWFTVDLRTRTFAAPGRTPRGLPAGAALNVTSAAQGSTQPGIARIGYFPDGSSSGGNITLSEAHRSLRVDVDWLTGAVTVSREAAR
ncbi:MAG: type II secretion system protein GspH [Rhodanobacteraceae bacterium]|nr:MAG: type II secretion system protein GspH [Rhodanobacteraceae bacterium]